MKEQESIDSGLLEDIRNFGTQHPNRYNTLWERFLASLIDAIFLTALLFPIQWFIYDRLILTNETLIRIWDIFMELVLYVYTISLHALYGRTIGKRVMGLKIIDQSEKRAIGFRQALLRDLVPLLGVTALCAAAWWTYDPDAIGDAYTLAGISSGISFLWFIAELATAAMNGKRRAVHDYIAGTVVVRL